MSGTIEYRFVHNGRYTDNITTRKNVTPAAAPTTITTTTIGVIGHHFSVAQKTTSKCGRGKLGSGESGEKSEGE